MLFDLGPSLGVTTVMRRRPIPVLLLPALLLLASAHCSLAASGAIWAAKVEGSAWIEGSSRTRLIQGKQIEVGAKIVTEANGNVILLFENGSTINVRPGTTFSIKEFACEPFDRSKVEWRALRSEPGESSRTKVQVDDGTIVANVRKLRRSSTFDIATPLGTAGIRGTTVYAEVDMTNADNPVSFGVVEGRVAFALNSGETRNIGSGSAVGVSPAGQFTPPPANAQQMLSTAQQAGQTMSLVTPPASSALDLSGGTTGTGADTGSSEATTFASASTADGAPALTSSQGTVTLVAANGAESSGSGNLGAALAPGTIITTGEDGSAVIDIGGGSTVQVQPKTQLTIGETRMDRAINEDGDPIPEVNVTLPVGTVIARTAGGANPVSPEVQSMLRLPFGRTWDTATPEQIRQAVLDAVQRNPDSAPEIVRAAIQNVRQTGRFPSSGEADSKQVVEDDGDGETSLQEMAAMIGSAATEGNPALAEPIAEAVAGATRSAGLAAVVLNVVTPRGTITPITSGITIISSTGADPSTSVVTVASPTGTDFVVTTEGEQLTVAEGLVLILRPDGIEYGDLDDYPDLLDGVDGFDFTANNVFLPPADLPPPNPPAPLSP